MQRFILSCVLITCFVVPSSAEEVTVDAESVVRYVESCRKPNGAFGPIDQEYTDAAWNYPAVWTLQMLNREIANPDAIEKHGLGSPAGHAGFGHEQFFHVHGIRAAIRKPAPVKHKQVRIVHRGFKTEYYASPLGSASDLLYKRPSDIDVRDAEADTFYYENLASLDCLLTGLRLSGRKAAEPQPLVDYILRRQASYGGFVDVRNGDLLPSDLDANVHDTKHAIRSLLILEKLDVPLLEKVANFVHSCRMKNGAYRRSPRDIVKEQDADVYDTWAALASFDMFSQTPRDGDATIAWINSLQNDDGGFGDRVGWRSRLDATFYAVGCLTLLRGTTGHDNMPVVKPGTITIKRLQKPEMSLIADGEFGIYQAQFKMPVVTVDELEGLRKRGFNLLALKTDKFDVVEPLLAAIRAKKLPMDVVLCPEAYPHRLMQTGGVTLNHVGNFTLDPRWTSDERAVWQTADAAGREFLSWAGYRDQVVKPMAALGSLVYPEQDYEQEYAYLAYGNDRSGERGYNAVLAGFNWPPYDFVRVFPWRERYVDRLTPIADVDAHGDLAKWSNQLDFTRTLFIARGPNYADFQEAAKAGRVVTVIAKAEGVPSGATYYGPAPAVDYLRRHIADWKWWK